MSTAPRASSASRTVVRDLLLLSALALAARIVAAALVGYPPFTDPAYYAMAADQLATGHGFTAPAMWSFLEVGGRLPAAPVLPVPSFGHWMPLTSLVADLTMWAFGPGWRAGQVLMVVLSAALVPFTYLVGWQLWGRRSVAWGGALLALSAGPLLVLYPLIDNFAVFGAAGAAALYAAMLATTSPRPGRWLLASGALVGVATLARIDGLLLAVAPAVAWWELRSRGAPGRWLLSGVGSGVACLGVLAPWLARNLATFGSPFPSAGGHTLWITSYNEQFSIGHEVTLAGYLATGPAAIIGSKLGAWVDLLGRTAVLCGGIFVVFFLVGLWRERSSVRLRPFIAYWVVMFAVMGLVFTFHAPRGAFYHSAPAWLPFALPLAVASLGPACTALARWWRFLGRRQTQRFILVVGLVGAWSLSLAGSATLLAQWGDSHRQDELAAAWFRDHGLTGDVVMSDDPASLWQASGNPGIPIPFDPYPVIGRAAAAYGTRWLVVERRNGAASDPLGLWEGGSAVDALGNRASWLESTPELDAGDVRIFRVIQTGG